MKKLFLILVLGLLPYSAQSYEYNLIDLGGMMNPPPTPEINCIPKDSTGSKEALKKIEYQQPRPMCFRLFTLQTVVFPQ